MMNKNSILAKMILAVAIIAGLYGVLPARATGTVYFVKWDASGANSGASWANAFTGLQTAISAAQAGDEIWVAAGTYKPTTGTDRSISFTLKNGVAIYGGFNGTETTLSQRNVTANVTTLSGDIGSLGVNTDNSYHVVVGSNTNSNTILDGFTIAYGYADTPSSSGGGLYSYLGNLTLSNLIFKDNSAMFGGGMYSEGYASYSVARPNLTNVTFLNNAGRGEGGGMENRSYSQPTLTNVSFINNTSNRSGGGMLNLYNCDSILTNVTFSGNIAAAAGGGLSNLGSNSTLTNVTFENNTSSDWAGGMDNADPGHTILTNVTFSGNSAATDGGAISNHYNATLTLTNVTINGNSAGTNGDGVYNDAAILTIRNSILHSNGEEIYGSATVTNSIVQGGYAGMGNLDANPLLGPLQDNGGFTKTMALALGSPAIDSADDSVCPDLDQRWYTRPQGLHCDMGAYEYGSVPGVTRTPTVTPSFTPTVPSLTPTNTFTPTPIPMYLLVTNTNDSGAGSLRQAIANIGVGGTIQFDPSLAGQTITLTSQIAINKNMTIDGSGISPHVEINGNNATRLLNIGANLTVSLRSLALKKGKTTGTSYTNFGGAIFVGSTTVLTLTDMVVSENTSYQAGAIYVSGGAKLVISNSEFSSNSSNTLGGVIYLKTVLNLTVTGSRFVNNSASSGGVVYLDASGKGVFEDNVFENNTASNSGGAIASYNSPGVGLYVGKNLFSNNFAGSGGGAISIERWASSSNINIVIENNTFFENQTENVGGALGAGTSVRLINNTFSHNSAPNGGASVNLTNLSVVIHEMYNNTLANSLDGSECISLGGTGSSNIIGNDNIVEDGSGQCSNLTGSIISDPILGPLQDNGGSTLTMSLLPGSPAIDAGDDANCPATDQRGVARPQGAHCDIGAYEYNAIIPTVTLTPSITPSPTFTRTPTAINRPDLTITDMRIELQNTNCLQPGDPLGVRVWIVNNGPIAASTFVVQVNGVKQSVSGLGAGDAKSLFFAGYSNPVTAIVDATGVIAESNENNNSVTQNVPVPTPPLPCTVTPTATQTPTVTATMTKSRTPSPTPTRPRPFMRSQILTPTSLTSDFGTTVGSLPSLGLLGQTGAEDDPAAYVSFQTPNTVYMGYQSFTLPPDARTDLIASMLLQVNFKGEASTTWTWSAYDWKSAQWIPLGNSIGAKAGMWKTLLFPIRSPWRFMSSRGEIRIQLKSNNATSDAKIDYEALHLTYLSIPATVTPLPTSSYKKGAPFPPTSTP